MPQRPESAHDGRDEPAHEGTIAVRECGESGMDLFALELLVERPPAAQDTVENVGGHSPGGEPRNLQLGAEACARHCSPVEANGRMRPFRSVAKVAVRIHITLSELFQ